MSPWNLKSFLDFDGLEILGRVRLLFRDKTQGIAPAVLPEEMVSTYSRVPHFRFPLPLLPEKGTACRWLSVGGMTVQFEDGEFEWQRRTVFTESSSEFTGKASLFRDGYNNNR